jgi:hypothetical protein
MESIYDHMERIEAARCDEDVLYRMLTDSDGTLLKTMCGEFVGRVRATFDDRSKRLDRILDEILTTDDRIALHGFLFFCLREHKWAVDRVLADASAPPEKISAFVMEHLPRLTDQLLRGNFTSLRSYVEEARWQYSML